MVFRRRDGRVGLATLGDGAVRVARLVALLGQPRPLLLARGHALPGVVARDPLPLSNPTVVGADLSQPLRRGLPADGRVGKALLQLRDQQIVHVQESQRPRLRLCRKGQTGTSSPISRVPR